MKYSLFILPRAGKELATLEETEYQKIKKAILRLADNPRPMGCSKLTGAKDGKYESATIESSTRSMIQPKK